MSAVGLFGQLAGGAAALQVNTQGTAVVGNNIANANTPGFHRRDLVVDEGQGIFPGAQVTDVQRSQDVILSRRLAQENGASLGASTTSSGLQEIEQAIQTGQTNLSQTVSNLAGALTQLGASPQDVTRRADVIAKGTAVTAEFNRVGQVLGQLQVDNRDRATALLPRINQLSQQAAVLNQQVLKDPPGSMQSDQDQLDQAAQDLSGLVGGDVLRNADGTVDVLVNGVSLVHGAVAAPMNVTQVGTDLQITVGGQQVQGAVSGTLGGYVTAFGSARDNLGQFNQLALDFSSVMNTQHALGVGLDGSSGNPFFQPLAGAAGAAVSLKVDPGLTPTNLAAGLSSAPGDNRNSVALANLLDQPVLEGGKSTFTGVYTRITTQLGANIQQSQADTQTAQAAQSDLTAAQQSESGVSTDEETTQLLAYQRGFEASSKFVQTIDSMIQAVVGIKTPT